MNIRPSGAKIKDIWPVLKYSQGRSNCGAPASPRAPRSLLASSGEEVFRPEGQTDLRLRPPSDKRPRKLTWRCVNGRAVLHAQLYRADVKGGHHEGIYSR